MNLTKSISLISGALLLASCSDNIYEPPVQEEFNKNFVDQFGNIDPNQDWNFAERKSVIVNPGSASDVKIYAFADGFYKLVGDYTGVSGQQTLTFDALKSIDDFMVVAGGRGIRVNNGGTANFAASTTRTYQPDVANVFTKKADYTNFTWDEVMSFANQLPEGGNNMNVGLTTNFKVISEDARKVTVYPVFWNANYRHVLGLFWKDANGEHYEDIYSDKQGDDVQVYVNRTYSGMFGVSDAYEGWESVTWNQFKSPTNVDKNNGFMGATRTYKGTIDESKGINSIGFTIDLPDGIEYGFYVKVYNGKDESSKIGTYYSDVTKNDDALAHSVFMRTKLEGSGVYRTFLGFEDQNGGGDKDLNDFMLILDPAPLVIDSDAENWIVGCEDLGSTLDFDFNDVVFSVNHVAGQSKATVQLLAAGGIYETYICRNGQRIGSEVHEWLKNGSATESAGASRPLINTVSAGAPGEAIEIDVPATFTMALLAGSTENMGGFSIEVIGRDQDGRATNITAPGIGHAPQMICVPNGWKWPKEWISISDAYPEFGQWGANYVTTEWYKHPVDEKVLTNK